MSQDERCENCPNPDEDGCPPGAAIECDLSKLTLDQLDTLIGQLHDRMQALEDQRDRALAESTNRQPPPKDPFLRELVDTTYEVQTPRLVAQARTPPPNLDPQSDGELGYWAWNPHA